jgi:hypothetical protein
MTLAGELASWVQIKYKRPTLLHAERKQAFRSISGSASALAYFSTVWAVTSDVPSLTKLKILSKIFRFSLTETFRWDPPAELTISDTNKRDL